MQRGSHSAIAEPRAACASGSDSAASSPLAASAPAEAVPCRCGQAAPAIASVASAESACEVANSADSTTRE
jgi:hypothetical protein